MSRFIKGAGAAVLAFASFTLIDSPQANAGGFSLSIGNFGYGVPYYSGRSRYRGSHYGYGRGRSHYRHHSYRVPGHVRHPRYPHYDYHPPRIVPHRGHFDYVPGHFDFHHRRHHH